ncbi:hypothetical protein ACG04R_26145 [Roseateles sp. BYS78W]|uniref:DUF1439 domain-containing protein n=1 Tax=Pelomonas candidula TaxID=3299025 RepID=A0ABW7HJY5_9BURK
MNALAISNQPSVVAARFLANLHRRALIALLAVVSLCVVSMPARSAEGAGMERALVSLLADPQIFALTPKSAADKLAPFGRLKEDKQGGLAAGGVALRTFYIDLQPVGRRAAVYFERSSARLTNITLMFSPEDAIDAARVRAALASSLGTAQEWSQAGSNRVVWWEGADGRRVQLTLDPPDVEPAQLYIASVGREVSGRR